MSGSLLALLCGACVERGINARAEGKAGFTLCEECSAKQARGVHASSIVSVALGDTQFPEMRVVQAHTPVERPKRKKVVYIAHPLRGATIEATERNRCHASELVAQIAIDRDVAPVATWIILAAHWSEAEGRARGLEIDKSLIEVCDELWIIGPKQPLSNGMQIEVDHALACGVIVVNLQGVYE